jgi:hypothetical protein
MHQESVASQTHIQGEREQADQIRVDIALIEVVARRLDAALAGAGRLMEGESWA